MMHLGIQVNMLKTMAQLAGGHLESYCAKRSPRTSLGTQTTPLDLNPTENFSAVFLPP